MVRNLSAALLWGMGVGAPRHRPPLTFGPDLSRERGGPAQRQTGSTGAWFAYPHDAIFKRVKVWTPTLFCVSPLGNSDEG